MATERVMASVILKSRSGLSIYHDLSRLSLTRLDDFRPQLSQIDQVVNLLRQAGFTIEAQTEVGVSFSGQRELFETEFGTTIRQREMQLPQVGRPPQGLSFYESDQPLLMSRRIATIAEAVQLAIPAVPFHNSTPAVPNPPYYFLNVLNDVPARLNVTAAHAAGITGQGVRVSMIDTGFITRQTEAHMSSSTRTITVDHPVRHVRGVWLSSDLDHIGTNFFTGGSFANNTITLGTALPEPNMNVEVVYSCLHPHYLAQGYTINGIRAIGGLDVNTDEHGHGTAEAANVLAVAPGAIFSFVKFSDLRTSYPLAAFQAAVQHQSPDIITCSWGTLGFDSALHLEVTNAVANGTVVIFSAGNGHTDGGYVQPIAHPNVLSIGGAYPIQGGGFRASDYASSYDSVIYTNPQRHCPDVVGLVGDQPGARLIMLPTEPHNHMDEDIANAGAFPNGDNTDDDDGWVVCSGTSAAAPQSAGMAALLLQQHATLRPMAVKHILENSARDVQTGTSANGDTAAPGWDAATGFGVIDGHAALHYLQTGRFNAYLRDSIEDNGTEPVVTDRLWASPDIIVRTEQVVDPQEELGQTVKHRYDLCDPVEDGQDNYIYLRLQNRGTQTGSCTATIYFTEPGMLPNPASWQQIGQLMVDHLEPGELRVVGPITWHDAQIPSTGHYCTIAILDSPSDPAPDLSAIHTADDFASLVRDKNNVAWKNVNIVDLIPGGSATYSFYMEGPSGQHQADLRIDLTSFPPGAQVFVKVNKRLASTATLDHLEVLGESGVYTTLKHIGGVAILEGMDFKSREKSKVTISYAIPANTPDGDYPIRATLLADGQKVGGFTQVVRIAHYAFIGNRRTREVHRKECPWVGEMAPYNRIPLGDLEQSHRNGFDNCAFCIGDSEQ